MISREHFLRLVDHARRLPALPAAFVYPCDAESLQLALSSGFTGHLAPVLVGPETKIRDTAIKAGIDLSTLPIIDTEDHPRVAATRAIELARERTVGALIKGSLGHEDLLTPVLAPDSGLRERRLSHAYFVDLPGRAHGILLADAQLNITPSLETKKDIVHNTVELAKAIAIPRPKVALLAALQTVSPAFRSTSDALALKAMAAQGSFPAATLDGPLTADSALSIEAAQANGRMSDVAGQADVLIVPTMESGLMVLRTLTGITGGLAAGLVLGAAVPIVSTARTETLEVRMASCVLAVLFAAAMAESKAGASAESSLESATASATV